MPEELEAPRAAAHAARDRARGAAQRKGQGLARNGSPAWKRNSPNLRSQRDALKAQWDKRKIRPRQISRNCARPSNWPAPKWNRPNARATSGASPNCSTAGFPQLEKQLKEVESQSGCAKDGPRLLQEEVTAEEIAEVVARWTGIPVSRLLEGEKEKLLRLDEILHERVIGQDEAVQAVADAVIRARSGLKDPKRPIGSFIFLGPTGVGKTELARALAESLFDSEENMIRIDMSEYMEKHAVARLIGAPPGYVGYEEGGQLTEAVRRRPYSCRPLRRNREGAPRRVQRPAANPRRRPAHRQPGPHGRFQEHHHHHDLEHRQPAAHRECRAIPARSRRASARRSWRSCAAHFRPEFLNRVDEIVLFKPLTLAEIKRIVDLQLDLLRERLAERHIDLELTDAAKEHIAREGYDPVYGARPLKRFLQRQIETALSRQILGGEITEGGRVTVDFKAGELAFTTTANSNRKTT